MKPFFYIIVAYVAVHGVAACHTSAESNYQPLSASGTSSSQSTLPATNGKGLTNTNVEAAVASMLREWRLGGSVSVMGIQELPQQNSAIADLHFEQFEYGITHEGGLVKAKDFKPKPMPKDQSRLPTMGEMFPQRKAVYSKGGKAILSHYTDGRWVLKEVRWGLDTGVNGTVEIR